MSRVNRIGLCTMLMGVWVMAVAGSGASDRTVIMSALLVAIGCFALSLDSEK